MMLFNQFNWFVEFGELLLYSFWESCPTFLFRFDMKPNKCVCHLFLVVTFLFIEVLNQFISPKGFFLKEFLILFHMCLI